MSGETPQTNTQQTATEHMKFRRRGLAVSRLEGFSDAVFAFALTLLVVSLQVLQTVNELLTTLSGFLPFALSFTLFIHLRLEPCDFRHRIQRRSSILRKGLEVSHTLCATM